MRVRPQRYKYPHCKWDFTYRKKKCCPGCGTLLLIASDMLSDNELTELRSFWMWDSLKERWDYVRDWEEHKREASKRPKLTVLTSEGENRRRLIGFVDT